MVRVEEAFFAISLIIFIGYFGLVFFKKTKISEILVLLIIGLFLGPVMGFLGPNETVLFEGFLPFFASFALMVILFEGGMQLNFFKTLRSLPSAFLFTIIVFVFSMGFIAAGWFIFTGNLLQGILLGAILGGTSSEIIIPLANNTSAKEEIKTLLGIESALTDALCVICAVAIAQIILLIGAGSGAQVSISTIGSNILAAFSIAAVVGFIFGIAWVRFLAFFEKKPYEYLLTLSVLLFLYSVVQFFGGNGAITALVFGIVLGNSEDLTSMLRLTPRKVEGTIKSFQMEVSFLVRTFFFVYLGILFKPQFLSDTTIILASFVIILCILVSRLLGSKIVSIFDKTFKNEELFMTTMSARGLAAAGLASFPIIVNLYPGVEFDKIAAIVFLIIFLSNIVTSIGVFVSERQKKSATAKAILEVKITAN
jgi:cell volume regulation protein A